MQHWTTEVFASNDSWLLLLLIHGCCFTQSMTVWLRPESPAHLLRPISCLRVSHCTPSFWVSLRLHPSSLSVREPEREANTRSLKCFPLKMFLFCFYSWVTVQNKKSTDRFCDVSIGIWSCFPLVFPPKLWLVTGLLLGLAWSAFPALWWSLQLSLIFHSPLL